MPRLEFDAIGTRWQIDTDNPLSKATQEAVQARIAAFDAVYSRFRDDSLVAAVAERAGRHSFPDDATKLFAFYRLLYEATGGKVTPLIGGLLEDVGYDAHYSLRAKPSPRQPIAWEQVLWMQGNEIFAHAPILLDIGAAGKGYLVDLVAEVLDEHGFTSYVIDAGGDIRHQLPSTERIGLEHPADATKVIGVAEVQGKSLCASAGNRRAWGSMHHIVDPHTIRPAAEAVATWAVADSTLVADGVATALFFCQPGQLQQFFEFEYVRILPNGKLDYSPGFQGELFV